MNLSTTFLANPTSPHVHINMLNVRAVVGKPFSIISSTNLHIALNSSQSANICIIK
uniref:Uncharacterized protein n=1 Tax=Rhizophora mucronata TaxID=61149 RepID=A0A2P2QR61_RHIMU